MSSIRLKVAPRPTLFARVIPPIGLTAPVVQIVTAGSGSINPETDVLLINRIAPSTTNLTLPDASEYMRTLSIVDYSTSVTEHSITIIPVDPSQTIMRQTSWVLVSSDASLASMTLAPVFDPDDDSNNVWIMAP